MALASLKIMLTTNYSLTNHKYNIYMYKLDLALNNPQVLICHDTQIKNHLYYTGICDTILSYLY